MPVGTSELLLFHGTKQNKKKEPELFFIINIRGASLWGVTTHLKEIPSESHDKNVCT